VSSKINGLGGNRPTGVASGQVSKGSARTASGASSESSGSSDSVHITDTASQLAALEQATKDLPVVDQSRVAAVRGALEQGTYTVAPQSVADNLLKMERSLRSLG
jgi:negative regulator of flagellin synthesis FlgM